MGTDWEQSPGKMMHIAVGYGPMLWGVDPWSDAWYKIIGTPKWADRETEDDWIPVHVKMVYLDVGRDGHVWALNDAGHLFWREGVTEDNKVGTEFTQKEYAGLGTLVGLGYCTDGQLWAINGDGNLYHKNGIVGDDFIGAVGTWTQDVSASETGNLAA